MKFIPTNTSFANCLLALNAALLILSGLKSNTSFHPIVFWLVILFGVANPLDLKSKLLNQSKKSQYIIEIF